MTINVRIVIAYKLKERVASGVRQSKTKTKRFEDTETVRTEIIECSNKILETDE